MSHINANYICKAYGSRAWRKLSCHINDYSLTPNSARSGHHPGQLDYSDFLAQLPRHFVGEQLGSALEAAGEDRKSYSCRETPLRREASNAPLARDVPQAFEI